MRIRVKGKCYEVNHGFGGDWHVYRVTDGAHVGTVYMSTGFNGFSQDKLRKDARKLVRERT